MSKITKVSSRQILDSRGIPSVEASIELENGVIMQSSCPSGISKSTYEASELRDQDRAKFRGLGVQKAVHNINNIIGPKLIGLDASEQQAIDKAMIDLDGTPNKTNLGANAILPVSQAVLKAAAKAASVSLPHYIRKFVSSNLNMKIPVPLFNVLEGGKHGRNLLNFQEFLVVPASSKTFTESLELGLSVYHSLEKTLSESSKSTLVADEGGYSPSLPTNEEAFIVLKESIDYSDLSFSLDVFLGLDAAATSFFENNSYKLCDRPEAYSTSNLADYYKNLASSYSLIYLEDPFAESDMDGWKKCAEMFGDNVLVVGDDIISTNPFRLQSAVNNKIVGAVVIKPNQIGTITETIEVVEMAKYAGLKITVSHRSGETEDTFIADFAVGVGADYVKFGAPARERNIKYNRLLAIEADLASSQA